MSCEKETNVPTLVYIKYDKANRKTLLKLKRSIDAPENITPTKSKSPTFITGVLGISKNFKSITMVQEDTFTDDQAAVLRDLY
ncbi:MAG: hypothetical protein VW378_03770 [bacterium]